MCTLLDEKTLTVGGSSFVSRVCVHQEKKKDEVLKDMMKDMKEKWDKNKDDKISADELVRAINDRDWLKKKLGNGVDGSMLASKLIATNLGGTPKSSACLVM